MKKKKEKNIVFLPYLIIECIQSKDDYNTTLATNEEFAQDFRDNVKCNCVLIVPYHKTVLNHFFDKIQSERKYI